MKTLHSIVLGAAAGLLALRDAATAATRASPRRSARSRRSPRARPRPW